MPIQNHQAACPHCHIQPALISQQTRRCTNCGKSLDTKPTQDVGKGVIQRNLREPKQLTFVLALPAVVQ